MFLSSSEIGNMKIMDQNIEETKKQLIERVQQNIFKHHQSEEAK